MQRNEKKDEIDEVRARRLAVDREAREKRIREVEHNKAMEAEMLASLNAKLRDNPRARVPEGYEKVMVERSEEFLLDPRQIGLPNARLRYYLLATRQLCAIRQVWVAVCYTSTWSVTHRTHCQLSDYTRH